MLEMFDSELYSYMNRYMLSWYSRVKCTSIESSTPFSLVAQQPLSYLMSLKSLSLSFVLL